MLRRLGKRIESIDEQGIPKFTNNFKDGKWVGEIELVKENGDTICNLCRNPDSVLTDDHVPPKCMGNTGKFHYVNYFNFMTMGKIEYFGIAQGGIKFKTSCTKCNNEVLNEYDAHISKFIQDILKEIKSGNRNFKIRCQPRMISKGLIGHFLTASLAKAPSQIEIDMFQYFWYDEPFKNDVFVYVLPYLDQNLLSVLRDIVWAEATSSGNSATINSMKCYPLGFLVYQGASLVEQEDWKKYLNSPEEYDILFNLDKAIDKWNPEIFVPENSVKVFGTNGAHSILAFREKEEF